MRSPSVLPAVLIVLAAPVLDAAPLHPRLLEDAAVRAAIPPEPVLAPDVSASRSPVATLATRFGRRFNATPRLLLLLVDFSDRPADPVGHDPEYYRDLLFSDGVQEYGSLREYYRTVSHGRMEITGQAFGWFRMPRPYTAYAGTTSGLCFVCDVNARTLALDALEAARRAGIDPGAFDNDGPDGVPDSGDDDGILDGLMVVFAGYGSERTGSPEDIRSHYADLPTPQDRDGIRIPDYIMIPERENIGIAVHELGHLWGGEDLYDPTGQSGGIGNFSIMAHGVWFNNGRSPGAPDPFTRILWGLVQPETPGADEPSIEIPSSAEEPYALRLWTRGEIGPEYFLVENRRPGGIDRFLAGDGLLVYHVDETQRNQSNRYRYRVSVVQADGLRSLEGIDPPSLGDAGDFFPGREDVRTLDDTTTPSTRSHDGVMTRVALRNIGDPGPRVPVSVAVGRYIASGPVPTLEVRLPEGIPFPPADPGGALALDLAIRNRGTRLGPGRVTVFSRDPRVIVLPGTEFDLLSVAALDTRILEAPVPVRIREGSSAPRVPVVLEARWMGEDGAFVMAAPVPRPANVVEQDGFEEERLTVSTQTLGSPPSPWIRLVSGAYEGTRFWTTRGFGARTNAVLELGPYPVSGYTELRFHHRMYTQADGEWAFDGGFLEISTDGGTGWSVLHPLGGYPGAFLSTDGNPYAGVPAWSGRIPEWEEVRVPVPAEGEVRFRFHFVSDFTGNNGLYSGWDIDGLLLRSWDRPFQALFDPPDREDPSEVGLAFSVVPLFETPVQGALRLVREGPSGRAEIGIWDFSDRREIRVPVAPPRVGFPERYYVEWDDPDQERVGPLVVAAAGPSAPWFAGSPAVLRSGEGGSIRYVVPGTEPVPVRIDLFDVRGTRVAALVDGVEYPGSHEVPWPRRGATGRTLPAGVYFLSGSGGGAHGTHRLVLVP